MRLCPLCGYLLTAPYSAGLARIQDNRGYRALQNAWQVFELMFALLVWLAAVLSWLATSHAKPLVGFAIFGVVWASMMQLQKERAFIWCSEALGARERTSLTDHFLADGIEEPKSRDKILSAKVRPQLPHRHRQSSVSISPNAHLR